ncbi:MAG: response regulator transcription factor [Chitinophagales bacterium]|nr:response regulator transcription factor [Chitinophagales bacterium]
MSIKILIVDDDVSICEILEFNLKSEGYTIEVAHSAGEALEKLNADYHLILLDIMMGGMSGYKMAEKVQTSKNRIPIIFITAKDTENDMLTGFSVGADDYISKPFSIKEVIARIKAILKRTNQNTKATSINSNTLELNDFIIDFDAKCLIIKDNKINLTKTEFDILSKLIETPNRIFSRQEIIDSIWGEDIYVTERTVDVHITRLRKKLGEYGSAITNRIGFGYRFDITNL